MADQITICPNCHKKGGRVVELEETAVQPPPKPQHRFPGDLRMVFSVYVHKVKWTCPECKGVWEE